MKPLHAVAIASFALIAVATASPETPAALLDEEFKRLSPAQIEDDLGGEDADIEGAATNDCSTVIATTRKQYRIDWREQPQTVLGDTFIFVVSDDIKFAIVGDASRADQADALRSIANAMTFMTAKCRPVDPKAVTIVPVP